MLIEVFDKDNLCAVFTRIWANEKMQLSSYEALEKEKRKKKTLVPKEI